MNLDTSLDQQAAPSPPPLSHRPEGVTDAYRGRTDVLMLEGGFAMSQLILIVTILVLAGLFAVELCSDAGSLIIA